MPVESGLIHRRFGRQTNPLTNTIENNSGIYIVAPNGADARAVFEGTVVNKNRLVYIHSTLLSSLCLASGHSSA